MSQPDNQILPFFAYGLFKPGQPMHIQLNGLVKNSEEMILPGNLNILNGLVRFKYDIKASRKVKGSKLEFNDSVEAYNRINSLEPSKYYKWEEIDGMNCLVARGGKGESILEINHSLDSADLLEYTIQDDKFFSSFFEFMGQRPKFEPNMKGLIGLQMYYSLLWIALERLVLLTVGFTVIHKITINKKIEKFEDLFQKYLEYDEDLYAKIKDMEISSMQDDRKIPNDEILSKLYGLRSNIVHQGKALITDYDRVEDSLNYLLGFIKEIFTKEGWN